MTSAPPMTNTSLLPAASRARAIASSSPSTNVNPASAGSIPSAYRIWPGLDLGVHSKVYRELMALRVSEVAQQAGVSADAVRFYEKEGLLPSPPRSPAGYREYDATIPHRIRFIKGAQEMGLKLAEIGELLEIQDRGACPCGHTKTLVERRIAEIDAEIDRLSSLRTGLAGLAELECSATTESDLWACEAEFRKRR
ncbi:MAG: MerR family DNA-binding protein [Actinobacteria bacterium]|nr:MerR family DNA-binding protein [Actinomycetota bacterium]